LIQDERKALLYSVKGNLALGCNWLRMRFHDSENSYLRLLSLKHRPEYPKDGGSPAIKVFPALSCHFRKVK
jgi:hypothetical protein